MKQLLLITWMTMKRIWLVTGMKIGASAKADMSCEELKD